MTSQRLPAGEPLKPSWKIARLVPLIRPGENGSRALRAAGKKGNSFNVIRLAWDAPAPTITRFRKGWNTALIHPAKDEQATGRELCRLQSFPDEYQWGESTYGQIQDRIGNSVPPLLMRAVAQAVRAALDGAPPERPGGDAVTGYGETLSAAWADHAAPRKPDAPTVASLFAGCGGSSLGYSMAGFRELLAVEWDDHAAAMFALNFPDVPLHHGDIAALDPATLGLAPGELDVLDGSPPCQGFSTSGRRQFDDPRNELFHEYVRLLDAWQPRAFVMENVTGLVKGKMKLRFAEMLRALRAAGDGYRVAAKVLDASYLGVPQKRQRLVVIGIRQDLDIAPAHPSPSRRIVTVRSAWADLRETLIDAPILKQPPLIALIPPGSNGANVLEAAGRKRSKFNLQRHAWNRPAFTVTKYRGWEGGGIHPDHDRPLTARELCRLQSFPDQYAWGGSTYAQLHDRIGNSVPPLLMRAVAAAVRDTLDMVSRKAVSL